MRSEFVSATSLLAAVLIAFPALAQEVPRYPVEAYCRDVSSFGGGSRSIYNGCIDMEQDAYDDLQQSWASLPSQTRSYCDDVARFGGGSYSILKGCIDMELDAAQSTPGFKY